MLAHCGAATLATGTRRRASTPVVGPGSPIMSAKVNKLFYRSMYITSILFLWDWHMPSFVEDRFRLVALRLDLQTSD
jgi:hypothetical protein